MFPPSIPQETGNMNKYTYHHNIKENYKKLFSCPLQFHYLHILALDHFIDGRWRNTSSGHPAASQRTWEAWLTSRCSSASGLDLHSTQGAELLEASVNHSACPVEVVGRQGSQRADLPRSLPLPQHKMEKGFACWWRNPSGYPKTCRRRTSGLL